MFPSVFLENPGSVADKINIGSYEILNTGQIGCLFVCCIKLCIVWGSLAWGRVGEPWEICESLSSFLFLENLLYASHCTSYFAFILFNLLYKLVNYVVASSCISIHLQASDRYPDLVSLSHRLLVQEMQGRFWSRKTKIWAPVLTGHHPSFLFSWLLSSLWLLTLQRWSSYMLSMKIETLLFHCNIPSR